MSQLLNYKSIGKGQTVVFLHGFLESISMWDRLFLWEEKFHSLLIDLPGHGLSKNEDNHEKPSMEFMAHEVLRLLDALNIKSYILVGHSMGGYVALEMKSKDIRCKKVILLNSNFWEDSEQKKKDRIRVADVVIKNKNLFLKEAIPNLYHNQEKYQNEIQSLLNEALVLDSFSIAYASLAMSTRRNFTEHLTNSPSDFLIIQGELDQIVLLKLMQSELGSLAVAFEIILNVGHMSHFENPSKVINLISRFVKENEHFEINF
ncbi:MAG: alpha/beta fold hydrolase [Flavobacteriia bacterium]|nr:alpha/beta fold hydrolase [Flavobacteriia bacterium]